MRKRDFLEIKGLDIAALRGKAEAIRRELEGLRMDKNMHKLKDLKSVSKRKRDLAQVLTVLRQKEQVRQLAEELGGSL